MFTTDARMLNIFHFAQSDPLKAHTQECPLKNTCICLTHLELKGWSRPDCIFIKRHIIFVLNVAKQNCHCPGQLFSPGSKWLSGVPASVDPAVLSEMPARPWSHPSARGTPPEMQASPLARQKGKTWSEGLNINKNRIVTLQKPKV